MYRLSYILYPFRYNIIINIDNIPDGVYYLLMEEFPGFAEFIRSHRKEAGLSQKEFAFKSGLGLRFIRDLEQGKLTLRLDKVNQALAMFGHHCAPVRSEQ